MLAEIVPMDEAVFKKFLKFAVPFAGTIFRSVSVRHSRLSDISSGEGSFRFGGRWNPPGIRANYGSLTPETAMAETLASARYHGFAVHTAMPRVFVAMRVKLSRIAELSDPNVLKTAKLSVSALVKVDWRAEVDAGKTPITQVIGKLAASNQLEAILVPSAAALGQLNLVAFVDNSLPSSRLEVLSPDEFPA